MIGPASGEAQGSAVVGIGKVYSHVGRNDRAGADPARQGRRAKVLSPQ